MLTPPASHDKSQSSAKTTVVEGEKGDPHAVALANPLFEFNGVALEPGTLISRHVIFGVGTGFFGFDADNGGRL
ncbi:MAG: hypothetical protein ACXWT3_07960 [Methylococcaceae bacterium]